MFLPLGKVFSIDAMHVIRKNKINYKHMSFASLALMIQIGLIYFFAFLLKTGVEWRGSGKTYSFLGLFEVEEFFMYVFFLISIELIFGILAAIIFKARLQ